MTPREFLAHVKTTPGCWLWQGAISDNGYGKVKFSGRTQYAHRVSWVLQGRSLPPGAELHHTCSNRACVNPYHLEIHLTRRSHRSEHFQTHCKRGHEFTPDNTIVTSSGKRQCRACARMRDRSESRRKAARERYRAKNKVPPDKWRKGKYAKLAE